jgi:hypothetical protein
MTIFDVYRPIMKHFRGKRARAFAERFPKADQLSVLDVGGFPAFWETQSVKFCRMTCLNIHEDLARHHRELGYPLEMVMGDGCKLDYPDGAFDLAFSNSVIEHVGTWDQQVAFANEQRRVGSALWIQTPAWEFPIEPHYIAPFIHYLPRSVQRRVIRWFTVWGWLHKPTQKEVNESVAFTKLLSYSEMKRLFPDCVILVERVLGIFPKSYIAFRSPHKQQAE